MKRKTFDKEDDSSGTEDKATSSWRGTSGVEGRVCALRDGERKQVYYGDRKEVVYLERLTFPGHLQGVGSSPKSHKRIRCR